MMIRDMPPDDARRVAEALKNAAALVRRGWTQGEMAVTALGYPTHVRADDARAWCATGALRRCSDRGAILDAAVSAVESLPVLDAHLSIESYNDTRGRRRSEVAEVLEQASLSVIEQARRAGAWSGRRRM